MVNSDANAANLGRDLLFVLMWIGAWGTLELFIQWLSANQKVQLLLYVILFISGFIALIFTDSTPTIDGKTRNHEAGGH